MAVLALTVRLSLALMFLGAGLAKLREPHQFAAAVRRYEVLPAFAVGPTARVVPLAEVAASLLLVLGVLPVLTTTLLGFLLIAFAVAMAINLVRGRQIDCGCYGAAQSVPISWGLVARNCLLAGAAAAAAFFMPTSAAAFAPDAHGTVPGGAVLAAGLLATLAFAGFRLTLAGWSTARTVLAGVVRPSWGGGER